MWDVSKKLPEAIVQMGECNSATHCRTTNVTVQASRSCLERNNPAVPASSVAPHKPRAMARAHLCEPLRHLQQHLRHAARAQLLLRAADAVEASHASDCPYVGAHAASIQHAHVPRIAQRAVGHCHQHAHASHQHLVTLLSSAPLRRPLHPIKVRPSVAMPHKPKLCHTGRSSACCRQGRCSTCERHH